MPSCLLLCLVPLVYPASGDGGKNDRNDSRKVDTGTWKKGYKVKLINHL